MSTRYVYKIKGPLVTLSKKLAAAQAAAEQKRRDYFKDMKFKIEDGCLTWSNGDLAGVPAIDPLPRHFKYVQKHGTRFMTPRMSTKLGKEEAKKWGDLGIPQVPEDIIKKVGLSTHQFTSTGLFTPHAYVLTEGHFLVSAVRVKKEDAKHAEEISSGEFDDLIEVHNVKTKKKGSGVVYKD